MRVSGQVAWSGPDLLSGKFEGSPDPTSAISSMPTNRNPAGSFAGGKATGGQFASSTNDEADLAGFDDSAETFSNNVAFVSGPGDVSLWFDPRQEGPVGLWGERKEPHNRGAWTFDEEYSRVCTFPARDTDMFADAFIEREDEINVLLGRIKAGFSVEWDGNNHRGQYDDDAGDAVGELHDILDEMADASDASEREAEEAAEAARPETVESDNFEYVFSGIDFLDEKGVREIAEDWSAAWREATNQLGELNDEADPDKEYDVNIGELASWLQELAEAKLNEDDDD